MRTEVPINIPAWWLIIIPVLMIVLLGLIIILVIHLVNNKRKTNSNEDENSNKYEDKTLTSWIKKKDLLYWLLIMCLGTISLFTFRYKDATEVISHWSFAGTIVSIILAVVAIGFTLFQTLSSNLSSEKIAVSADKIEQATLNLDSKALSESTQIMIESADYLKAKIGLIEEKLNIINYAQETFNEMASTGFGQIYSSNSMVDFHSGLDISIESFIDSVFPELPGFPQVVIYSYLKIYSNDIEITPEIRRGFINAVSEGAYSSDNNEFHKGYIFGANTASQGATDSFIMALGVVSKFKNLSKSRRDEILEKLREYVDNDSVMGKVDVFINSLG